MKHSTDAAGVARQAFADLHDLQTGNDAALRDLDALRRVDRQTIAQSMKGRYLLKVRIPRDFRNECRQRDLLERIVAAAAVTDPAPAALIALRHFSGIQWSKIEQIHGISTADRQQLEALAMEKIGQILLRQEQIHRSGLDLGALIDAALPGKYSRPQGRISEERRRSRDV